MLGQGAFVRHVCAVPMGLPLFNVRLRGGESVKCVIRAFYCGARHGEIAPCSLQAGLGVAAGNGSWPESKCASRCVAQYPATDYLWHSTYF